MGSIGEQVFVPYECVDRIALEPAGSRLHADVDAVTVQPGQVLVERDTTVPTNAEPLLVERLDGRR